MYVTNLHTPLSGLLFNFKIKKQDPVSVLRMHRLENWSGFDAQKITGTRNV